MDRNPENCPVSGKRKYDSEREALATAAHQISTNNAPKDLKAYQCSGANRGISRKAPRRKSAERAPNGR